MMIIEVPLFIQTNQFNCGPTCLKMVLAHFGEHFGVEVLEKRMGMNKNKGVNSIQVAAAAASLGYGVLFYSKYLAFNDANNDLDFYKRYNDLDSGQINLWIEKARESGAIVQEKQVALNDLLTLVSEDSIPIVLLDWNIINNGTKENYQGHFVPVVGYDHKYVYIHNGGYNSHQANIPVERELFEKARKAKGTDEDLIVIFRKGTQVKQIKDRPKQTSPEKSIKEEGKKTMEIKKEKKEITQMEKEMIEMKKKIETLKNKIKNKT